jgi:serine phosphatase RsbU (regulator of sigma subunit)
MSMILSSIAQKLWPGIHNLPDEIRTSGMANILTVLYSTPLAILGLIWLIDQTELDILIENWVMLLFIFGLMYILERLSFFVTIETGNGRYVTTEGSLDSVMLWSAILLFGATAIWLGIIWLGLFFLELWTASRTIGDRWNAARNLTMSVAAETICILLSLYVYTQFGGTYPIQGLNPNQVFPAFLAMIVFFLSTLLLWSGFIIYILRYRGSLVTDRSAQPVIRLILLGIVLPNLANPFALLSAGLYVQNTIYMFLYLVVGLFLVAILARKLSMEAEFSRQRARQLKQLELLGEDIINSPPDASTLPALLEKNVPTMFSGRIIIWVASDQILLCHPKDWEISPVLLDTWLSTHDIATAIEINQPLPWDPNQKTSRPAVICPIYDIQNSAVIGGIFLELRGTIQPWHKKDLESLYPPLYSLSSQITSALNQAERYAQLLEYQKMSQELALAGRIQASFLPNRMPTLPGWQLAVTLLPARATSGDFFDFIQLSNGKIGIAIADVMDKGIGPALYMALSRTLLRTFAKQYEEQPDLVMYQTNQRILSDASANLFVTLFYGILDWQSGKIKYCNAGHNPPIILSSQDKSRVTRLDKTGIPIGIDEGAIWECQYINIHPGDVLVLYTDGVTEAQNPTGDFFDEDLLIDAVQTHLGLPAHEIQASILDSLQNFVGDFSQSDDITLMILTRDNQLSPNSDSPVN